MKSEPNIALLVVALAALVILPGCLTYSLHPLYTDDDPQLTYAPALEGTWVSGNDDSTLFITGDSKTQQYSLQLSDGNLKSGKGDGVEFKYGGRLIKLGGERFLDATPSGDDVPGALPTHSIFKVSVQGDSLRLSPLDDSWLCAASEAEQALPGQCVDGDFIVTAPTDVLQEFVQEHADDDAVFPTVDESDGLHRAAKPGSAK